MKYFMSSELTEKDKLKAVTNVVFSRHTRHDTSNTASLVSFYGKTRREQFRPSPSLRISGMNSYIVFPFGSVIEVDDNFTIFIQGATCSLSLSLPKVRSI